MLLCIMPSPFSPLMTPEVQLARFRGCHRFRRNVLAGGAVSTVAAARLVSFVSKQVLREARVHQHEFAPTGCSCCTRVRWWKYFKRRLLQGTRNWRPGWRNCGVGRAGCNCSHSFVTIPQRHDLTQNLEATRLHPGPLHTVCPKSLRKAN